MPKNESTHSKAVVDLRVDSEDEAKESSPLIVSGQQQEHPLSDEKHQKKRSLQDNLDHESDKKQRTTSKSFPSPIKLLATRRHIENRPQHLEFSSQCSSLRELLGIDFAPSLELSSLPPVASSQIDWLVVANYIIDFEFLLEEVPELISIPVVTVFFGSEETPGLLWKRAAIDPASVDLVPLRPSDPPQSSTNPLASRIPYGVHHSKIFLVGFSDRLRVVIHTANLRHSDVHLKAQAAFVQDFPFKTNPYLKKSAFEQDLVAYFQTYEYHRHRAWIQGKPPQSLVNVLSNYDFSSARALLVPSSPGYHHMSPLLPAELRGHLKLRYAIREHCRMTTDFQSNDMASPIICQFSSMGSVTAPYLQQLQDSMDIASAQRPKDARPGNNKNKPLALRLVYPTPEEIRTSIEGYRGGASVPSTLKNVTKPFLRPLYCRWRAEDTSSDDHNSKSNLLFMSQHVPHIKTYYQIRDANSSKASMEWFVLSSHNLSKAAWGEIQNSSRGRRLFVRHWELGAFLSPSLLHCERLVPWSETADNDPNMGTVPLPYAFVPSPYRREDQPWAVDQSYAQTDRFGRLSAHDL